VVLDRKGQPVKGLAREDFTVLDEGRPQPIVSFDLIEHTPAAAAPGAAPAAPPPVATNVGTGEQRDQRGRRFLVLFDDLSLTPINAIGARKAVTAFVDSGTAEGDEVTLFTTSGAAWWTTTMPGGREDLLAVLKRLDGRRILETATERITDYEAVQIIYYRNVEVAARVQDRLERYGSKLVQSPDRENYQQARTFFQRGVVDPYVENLAMQTYMKAKVRMEASLGTIERAIRALSAERSRKALVLVSEGFVDDPTQSGPRRVLEAARRSNATIYYVDPTGLRALDPMYDAEFGPSLDTRDTMTAIADLARDGEGAAVLAERTGGFSIRDTNAFDESAVRIGRESQSYYLLGFNPGEIPRDGKFRKLEVRVRGANLTVRARRGYFAPQPEGEPDPAAGRKDVDSVLQRALDASRPTEDIPLRLSSYVMEGVGLNRTRVVLAADAEISGVEFKDVDGHREASLDTIVVVAHRDSGEVLRSDQKVDIRLKQAVSAPGRAWYSFLREFEVSPGHHQVKLVVRDPATDRVGTVVQRFAVDPASTFHLSTPLLTDTSSPDGVPVPLARRVFSQSSSLMVRFDVYGAKPGPDAQPRVRASHALRRGGDVVGSAAPSLIQPTSIGALARMVQFPLRGFPPGDYELLIAVTDEVSGETREKVEPFTIAPAAAAAAPAPTRDGPG
jgi:VWFA-related protein